MIVGECYAGLDLSERNDLTALVVVGQDAERNWLVFPYFWTPGKTIIDRSKRDRAPYDVWAREDRMFTTPGASVEYDFVVVKLPEILADFDMTAIAFDRWRIEIFQKELDRIGLTLPMVQFGQGYKDMAPAIDTLESVRY